MRGRQNTGYDSWKYGKVPMFPNDDSYAIKITGLAFSASHFITFGRARCEPVHGHTFRMEVVWSGALGKYGYVLDFRQLRNLLIEIVRDLDDRLLLPQRNPFVHLFVDRSHVQVQTGRFTLQMPRSACTLLEVENVTAEALAAYIARRLDEEARARSFPPAKIISVWIEEEPGCWAGYQMAKPSLKSG